MMKLLRTGRRAECASCEQAQKDYAELERVSSSGTCSKRQTLRENDAPAPRSPYVEQSVWAATTKLDKLSTPHPRLEVRYWTGEYWSRCTALFYAALDALFTVPTTEIQEAEQIYAEELPDKSIPAIWSSLNGFEDWLADHTGPVLSLEEVRDAIAPKPRFQNVSCSQCGRLEGGRSRFSHCENHK